MAKFLFNYSQPSIFSTFYSVAKRARGKNRERTGAGAKREARRGGDGEPTLHPHPLVLRSYARFHRCFPSSFALKNMEAVNSPKILIDS